MKKQRRNHSPQYKAKVALEAAEVQRTVADLSRQYGVQINWIRAWKKQHLKGAINMFAPGVEWQRDQDAVIQEGQVEISRLTMERDDLFGRLAHFRRLNASPWSIVTRRSAHR